MMDYLLLLVGFALLVKGADFFVDGSSSVARLLKIPTVIIGLTIVAMGTSMPEASVSISASLAGNNDIAISNVVGSNIFNSLVVVGLCAALLPFKADKDIIRRDLPVNIIVSIILALMILDGNLSRIEGLILLLIMLVYIGIMIKEALANKIIEDEYKVYSPLKSIIMIIAGLMMIILGGNMVVTHASNIARVLGLSQNLIGMTIVAIGTSLPELVTSLVAVFKKDAGLALGNAIGSNIFNILFILGASSMLSPLMVGFESIVDAGIMILVAIVMYLFGRSNNSFGRLEGIICVIAYIINMVYLIIR